MSAGTRSGEQYPTKRDDGPRVGQDREGRLGAFLCWAVVFADLGTSVYYTPGILFQQPGIGVHAALFVSLTLLVFVLLAGMYQEVAIRYPEGGGVVTVATQAIHPFAGVLGGLFILVDYVLTAALSALSGIIYLSDAVPILHRAATILIVTVLTLLVLGGLNVVGVSVSARVNALFATIAAASQLAVVVTAIGHIGPAHLLADIPRVLSGPPLTPLRVLTGYAGAFLAFSGLESISQLAPVIAAPRERTTRLAMRLVVASMILTSPLLTLWATTELPITNHTDPNQLISLLAGFVGPRPFEMEVALSGALLLVFASNTAIIGGYHVFLALARQGFLPPAIARRNRWRGTPHRAILTVVAVPVVVLTATRGNAALLGDLYAFGLLGAFTLTCLSLDIVRWHERHAATAETRSPHQDDRNTQPGRPAWTVRFALGILTTGLVGLAWTTNLIAKPLATAFGGGITLIGLVIAFTTYALRRRAGRPVIIPLVHHETYPVLFLRHGRRARPPAAVLAILPGQATQIAALVEIAMAAASEGPIVFVQRGRNDAQAGPPALFEIADPYLNDAAAHHAFAHAERLARRTGRRHHYLYLPGTANPETITAVWRTLRPDHVIATAGDADLLTGIPAVWVHHSSADGVPIVHLIRDVFRDTTGTGAGAALPERL